MTCKLSLSSPFIIIRIKLFVARSVVRSVVYSCAALSRSIQKRKQPHTRFFAPFWASETTNFLLQKQPTRGEEESSASGPSLSFFSPPASSEPKLLPQERKRIKISLKSFSKKIQFNFSLILHKNHSLKTQWLVLNKPLVNPPVRSNSRSFK